MGSRPKRKDLISNIRNMRDNTLGVATALLVKDENGEDKIIHARLMKRSMKSGRQYLQLDIDESPQLLLFPDTGKIRGVGFAFESIELLKAED